MNDLNKTALFDTDQLLEVISILTEIVQQGLDLEGVMFLVAERTQMITKANGAVIELAEDDEMVYRATSGVADKQIGLRVNIDSSLSGLTFKLGTPFICYDSENDDRVDLEACKKVGLRSMAIVPLIHNNSPVGVLKVIASETNVFDQNTLNLLELMSCVIASSMFNAAKYESDELFYRATYDTLTGVANRSLFYDRLRQRFSQAQRLSDNFGVISIDVDFLKCVNDTLGHRAGDSVLKEISIRIQKVIREIDTLARLGGDEFAILVYKINNIDEAKNLMERIEHTIQKPFIFRQFYIPLSISMGFAQFTENCSDIEELIEIADQNMYCNKLDHRCRKLQITPISS
ncbi:MAG: sensor domain-containing diguanylate cyclase [Clostridiales bacterium]|nr:sensor domain-containing diguanylate cyclase [Clostridiales bacterium]